MSDVTEKVLALPASAMAERRTCFFAVPVPVGDRYGKLTGVQLQSRACGPDCAVYDRVGDRSCLTALREDLVAAVGGNGSQWLGSLGAILARLPMAPPEGP